VTGYLVEGHDPADHAERLLALLGDPLGAAAMSRAAVEHSMRFSWDATAGEIDAAYRELLADRHPGPIAA
jgi:D-inositol-3-phosphate glycosyltransferase